MINNNNISKNINQDDKIFGSPLMKRDNRSSKIHALNNKIAYYINLLL